jgi:hypothetical protein
VFAPHQQAGHMGAPTAKHDQRFSLPTGRRPHMGWFATLQLAQFGVCEAVSFGAILMLSSNTG